VFHVVEKVRVVLKMLVNVTCLSLLYVIDRVRSVIIHKHDMSSAIFRGIGDSLNSSMKI
jgi:hypothetical protein